MCALCFLLKHGKEKTLKALIASFAIAACSTYFLSQRMLRCFEKGLLKETRFVPVNASGVFWGMQDEKNILLLYIFLIMLFSFMAEKEVKASSLR